MDFVLETAQLLQNQAIAEGEKWTPKIGEIVLVSNGDAWTIAFFTGYKKERFFATQFYSLSTKVNSGSRLPRSLRRIGKARSGKQTAKAMTKKCGQ